jgi:hypothetical protein
MALFTLTINNLNPAIDKKNQEVNIIARALNMAAQNVEAAGGQMTSGNVVIEQGNVGSWTYTPQAGS